MSKLCVALLSLASFAATNISVAAEGVHWSYSGATGPEHWAELSEEFAACGIGLNQSPVDISDTVATNLDTLNFDYKSKAISIVNNGHTLQVNVSPGSWLYTGDEKYQLIQFHVHSPSEHRVNGELFPFAAHFVHQDASGALAVVGVLFRTGEWNENLAKLGAAATKEINQPVPLGLDLRDVELYTNHESYYRYSGSLTTPPCTEGVRWFVLKAIGHIAPEQAAMFVSLIGEDARGPQPLNARIILEH
jgi:carbonic anhydrase